MLEFDYSENEIKIVRYNNITNNKDEIAFVKYYLMDDVLTIVQIERNSIANLHFDNSYHFGTEVFNKLLCYLKEHNINFTKINGNLSIADALNNNWDNSISFYYNFPKYLDRNLDYFLEFHLYNKSKQKDEVAIPKDESDRTEFIRKFKNEHILNQGFCANSDASFCYLVVGK